MELRRNLAIRRTLMLRAAYEAGFLTGELIALNQLPPACPFDPGSAERDEWRRGYRHAQETKSTTLELDRLRLHGIPRRLREVA